MDIYIMLLKKGYMQSMFSCEFFFLSPGSIPLFWSQRPYWNDYRPPPILQRSLATEAAFLQHMESLHRSYGGVICVNLVRQNGSEWVRVC